MARLIQRSPLAHLDPSGGTCKCAIKACSSCHTSSPLSVADDPGICPTRRTRHSSARDRSRQYCALCCDVYPTSRRLPTYPVRPFGHCRVKLLDCPVQLSHTNGLWTRQSRSPVHFLVHEPGDRMTIDRPASRSRVSLATISFEFLVSS